MSASFIKELQRRRSDYSHPDQATTQEQSLIQLSSGIYTEEERFVFELLQNAVDAFNNESGILDIRMIIEDNYFIFLHNGDAFTERDIEGLCDVGNGNKMMDTKKIGYKGIGFKSVFMCSTCVTVESGGYCFKFDKSYWDGYWDKNWKSIYGAKNSDKIYLMPWQIIPIESNTPIKVNTQNYNVVTYIQTINTSSLEEKIVKLMSSSQFLLFLKCTNIKMELIVSNKSLCNIEKYTKSNTVTLFSNNKEDSKWLLYSNEAVEVPENLRININADIKTPQKLKDAKSFDLSFAIKLDQKGKLKKLGKEDSVIYTYLPTSYKFGSEGFPFLVNANFITDSGRQQLHKDSEWNKLIFSKIPFEFISWIKNISSSYENYYEILPEKSYGDSNALEKVYAIEMEKALDRIPFIPSIKDSRSKLLAKDAFMDRMGISKAISSDILLKHINRIYNHTFNEKDNIASIWNGCKILEDYGVFIFDKQKIKRLFDDENAFNGIKPDLDIKLIKFLFKYYIENQAEQEDLIMVLNNTKFLLDDNNNLCIPSNLFFPSEYKQQNDLAEDAKILNYDVYKGIIDNNQILNWLKTLGIKELSDISFIENVICKYDYINKENAIEVGRFLYNSNKKSNIFDKINTESLNKITFLSKSGKLHKANELYLGSYYKPNLDIEEQFKEDIYVSEEYSDNKEPEEWGIFFRKSGMNYDLNLKEIILRNTHDYSFLNDLKEKYENEYNISSWGNKFYYSFSYFKVQYAPFILTNDCSLAFQKIIWSSILSKEYHNHNDTIEGYAGSWNEIKYFSKYNKEEFLVWAFENVQRFPSTDGNSLLPNELLLNTEDIVDIAGQYLPIINVDCVIHESWNKLLNLRNILLIDDYLTLLTNISEDTENANENKERINKIYQRLIEIGTLSLENNRDKLKMWARKNKILSNDNVFVNPSELNYITIDGFSAKNRVYIGKTTNKDKIIKLLELLGVKVIDNVKAKFENEKATEELRIILMSKLSALALIASNYKPKREEYNINKEKIKNALENTFFYQCDKIKLSYGNNNDIVEKYTYSYKNKFYYINNLRPANIEPLLTPLCNYLNIKGKERDVLILMIEDNEGIRQNLKDKEYDISLIEKEPDSGNLNTIIYLPKSDTDRNIITGFKGEILIYEKLKQMGYEPNCPSVSTKENYDNEINFNGRTYFCKKNYNKYDISFTTKKGIKMFVEVKATTSSKEYQNNMPISYNELSMVEECNNCDDKAYVIARVFGIDSPKQDIYIFKGHLLEE